MRHMLGHMGATDGTPRQRVRRGRRMPTRDLVLGRNDAGFSLYEVLGAVAVLVILMALAIPALMSLRRDLRQMELDSKAETIYVAAQNEMTKLRSGGSFQAYQKEGTNAPDTRVYELPGDPSDRNGAIDGSGSPVDSATLCYMSYLDVTDSGSAAYLVMGDTVVDRGLVGGRWVIEFDPLGSSIYAVWYSEGTGDELSDYATDWDHYDLLRYRGQRLADGARVGYYGGDSESAQTGLSLRPVMTVTNAERLTVLMQCVAPGETSDIPILVFDVTLSDDAGHSITTTYRYNSGFDRLERFRRNYYLTLTLDDLATEATRFNRLYGTESGHQISQCLVPGSELRISLTVSSTNMSIVPKTIHTTTNGLFADATNDHKDAHGKNDTAVIAYGRHLQNLDVLDKAGMWVPANDTIRNARQVADISFREDASEDSWHALYCGDDGVYFNGKTDGKRAKFLPISASNLRSYDGQGHTISGLTVEETTGPAGLFAEAWSNLSVSDLTLVGASVSSKDGSAGALFGEVTGNNVTISKIGARLSRADGDLRDRTADTPFVSGKDAGGLVGKVTKDADITVSQSFASTILKGKASSGGVVGSASGTLALERSYADGYVTGKVVGGLVGDVTSDGDVTLNGCYAVGYLYPRATGAGLVAGAVRSAADTYTICSFDEGTANIYSTAKSISTKEDVLYLRAGSKESNDVNGTTKIGKMTNAAILEALGSRFEIAPAKSHPYRLLNQSITQYERPKLKGIDHYGDWASEFQSGALAYYEEYSGGDSYGFFGGNALSTLTDAKTVTGDGYALVYRRDDNLPASVKVEMLGEEYEFDPSDRSVPRHVVRSSDGHDYVLYPLPTTMVNAEPRGDGFYAEVTITSTGDEGGTDTVDTVYANPHFAMTAGEGSSTALPSGTQVNIRTARQLHALSLYYDAYATATQGRTFTQMLDIDYSTYDWEGYYDADGGRVTQQVPIGQGGADHPVFDATYDGQCHIIRDIDIVSDDGDFIGLFGASVGTIRNVVLWADYEDGATDNYTVRRLQSIGTNEKVYIGTLLGYNGEGATVRNCAVAGYYLAGPDGTMYAYANSNLHAGGLVGGNEGLIERCSSDCPTLRISSLNAETRIGGLAGLNAGTGTISSCYALGHVDIAWSRGGSVSVSGFCGDNQGIISGSYCCLSMTASGTAATTHGFATGNGRVSGSYYLSDGTYLYAGQLRSYVTSGSDTDGTAITRKDLEDGWTAKADAGHTWSYMGDNEGEAYPFRAVVRDASNRLVHYGDWQSGAVFGRLGLFYWEHEEGGSNDGYHISYIGVRDGSPIVGSTLCNAHDDGGVITEYGYGYLVERGETEDGRITQDLTGLESSGDVINATAKDALEMQVPGYAFYPYRTSTDGYGDYICLAPGNDVRDGIWELTFEGDGDPKTYRFTVSPFFANAMSYDGAGSVVGEDGGETDYSEKPGTEGNAYEVRSIGQLQYINWNGTYLDTETVVDKTTYLQFPYLQHATSLSKGTQSKATITSIRPEQYWKQTHDVSGYDGMGTYTPIAALATNSAYKSYDSVLCAWFGGTYDGQSYKIQNFDIVSDCFSVGVFGETVGANIRNVILYSDQDNVVERVTDQGGQVGETPGSYAIGGIVGIAYDYNLSSSTNYIENCAVAGYRIIDSSTNAHTLGGANIGGLAGITGVNLERCSAVADIELRCTHPNGTSAYGNYIHVGMLSGAVRYHVTDCYTGGTISIDDNGDQSTLWEMFSDQQGTYDPDHTGVKNRDYATHIYVGGIGGSAFTVNYVNFTNSSGAWNSSRPVYTNCYSYTRLPSIKGNVRGVALIGSIADRYGQGKPVTFDNCHYLESLVSAIGYEKTPYHFEVNRNDVGLTEQEIQDILNGDMRAMKHIVHNDNSSDTTPIGVPNRIGYWDLRGLAGTLGDAWGMVTTTEGTPPYERDIPGKYSFPGGHAALLGMDYPFPTVVTQPDLTFNREVYVHYGDWLSDGFYWAEGIATVDIFRDMGEGGVSKTLRIIDDTGTAGMPSITVDRPDIAMVLGNPREVDGGYEVVVIALKEGATSIVATAGNDTASMVLDVTAKLSVSCNPRESVGYQGENRQVAVSASSTLDASKDYTTSGRWTVTEGEHAEASVADGTLRLHHDIPGSESLRVTFAYDHAGNTYTASMFVSVTTLGDVGLTADPSLTDGTVAFSQAHRQKDAGSVVGTDTDTNRPPSIPDASTGDIFLYETRSDTEQDRKGVSDLDVVAVRFDYEDDEGEAGVCSYHGDGTPVGTIPDGIEFDVGFDGRAVAGTDYEYLPGHVAYLGTVPIHDITMTVTLTHPDDGETAYVLSVALDVPDTIVTFDANGGDGRMPAMRTSQDEVTLPECGFTRDGYLFAGWLTEDGRTLDAGDTLELEGSTTVTATWSPIGYTIEFDENGGTGEMEPIECEYDEEVGLSPCGFEREGWVFLGWATDPSDDVAYADEEVVSNLTDEDGTTVTLYAVWERIWTLTLEAGDSEAYPETQEFEVISTTTALDGYVVPEWDGYTLLGWETGDGELVLDAYGDIATVVPGYTDEDSFALTTHRTLHAIWEDPFALVSEGVATYYAAGTFYDLYEVPERDDATLLGWYTSDDPSEATLALDPDGTPVSGFVVEPGVTLYAQWSVTLLTVRDGWTASGDGNERKWIDEIEVDLANGEYIEVQMDLSTCYAGRENILGFGQDITKWAGCYGMQFYFEPTSETRGNLRPTVLSDKNLGRRDIARDRDSILTLTLKADEFLIDGQRDTNTLENAYANLMSTLIDNTTWQIGSAEGSVRSYASDYIIKVVRDELG